jgi:hypothetical protein
LSRQRSDEALVMKIFDNKEGLAGCETSQALCLS